MKLFLVDDHLIVLGGLTSIIENYPDLEVIGSSFSAKEAIVQIRENQPDVLITDFSLPDIDGMQFVREIRKEFRDLKIIVLSMHEEASIINGLIHEGINGYVLKKENYEELINAIHEVHNGQVYVSDEINKLLLQSLEENELHLLTKRELQIIRLIANEFTNRQIAQELTISERTVETHRKNIFKKTQTNNMVGLLKYAYTHHLI